MEEPIKNHLHPTSCNLGFFHLRLLGPTAPLIVLRSDRLYSLSLCPRRRRCLFLLASGSCRRRRHLLLNTFSCGLRLTHDCSGVDVVLVNGRPLQAGGATELAIGDEVSLLLGDTSSHGGGARHGFVVEKFVSCEGICSAWDGMGSCEVLVSRAESLLRRLRSISESRDPISCLRSSQCSVGCCNCSDLEHTRDGAHAIVKKDVFCSKNPADAILEEDLPREGHNLGHENLECHNFVTKDDIVELSRGNEESRNGKKKHDEQVVGDEGCSSDGSTFFLNRLTSIDPGTAAEQCGGVTLPQLLHPVDGLVRVFIATFTSDISWFLDYCKIPEHLPVTIACHNREKCWSASRFSRTDTPFASHPNLLLVHPRFPEVIAFRKDRKKQGVACHHPKLVVLLREDSVRVVVTSANLVPKQWHLITNTVWWQDFPRRASPDYSDLFNAAEESRSDFAAQLVSFVAAVINEVPSQAYWINEIAKYDFGGAIGHLVASVPGVYVESPYYLESNYCLSAKQILHAKSAYRMFLGSVQASVVGLSHRFHVPSDSGSQLRTLSAFLGKCHKNVHGTTEVILKRNTNIPADSNAVSVLVTGLGKFSEEDSVQLGFLPREVAKWISPLSDMGFFNFSAFIYPKEALEAAFGVTNAKVQLFLYVSKGPQFSQISELIQVEHLSPLCSLVASMKRCLGLWRLKEVLSRFKWPESLETDFIYSASSIGTSVNSQFIASFAAATGKRSCHDVDSQESDPEWGCWTANHESKNPSIRLLFPTIDRVKNSGCGIQLSRCLLSLPEKTWQRLRTGSIFHDAVPHPSDRVNHPMHVKVARRRFESPEHRHSFGWTYCGSHNFSPAAWGQLVSPSSKPSPSEAKSSTSAPMLIIRNYELGVVLVVPPSGTLKEGSGRRLEVDDIALPFVAPAPQYKHSDRAATPLAMREAMAEAWALQGNGMADLSDETDTDEDMPDEDKHMVELSDCSPEEKEEERIYAEMLWGLVEPSQKKYS